MSGRAIYGHPTLITRSYISTDASTPILAQSADPSRTQPRGLSSLDYEGRLQAALRAKYETKNQQGQVVTPAPPLVAFFPGTQEVLFQQPDGRLWIAPFLINGDSTFSIGEPTPVLPTYVAASAVPSRTLQDAVRQQYAAWGLTDPDIVAIRATSIVVRCAGEFEAHEIGFFNGQVVLGGSRPVQPRGQGFSPVSTIDQGSEELHGFTLAIQSAARERGREVDYGTAQIAASLALKTPAADRAREFPQILTMLFGQAK